MNRILRMVLSGLLAVSLCLGSLPAGALAKGDALTGLDAVLAAIAGEPAALSEDGTQVVLPESGDGDYGVRLASTSNPAVVSTDGSVHTPLVTMNVNLFYEAFDKNSGESKYTNTATSITVPGQFETLPGDNAKPNVVPGLREWKGSQGVFELPGAGRLVVSDAAQAETAEKIAYYFAEMLHRNVEIAVGEPADGDIALVLDESRDELGAEGYSLDVGDRVTITAPTQKGLLYGGTTLTQILYQDPAHAAVPKGVARDYPQYAVRSCMLDVARMYIPIDYLEEITKYMAYFKLNEIHVHINDEYGEQDGSFRVESKRYPALNDGVQVYTQDEYRAYQKECAQYGIEVVTEIDTPAHSRAICKAFPEISLADGRHLDVEKPETLEFMKSLFDEFLDGDDPVFQGSKFNFGTDEYDKAYSEQMRAYIDALTTYINAKGLESRCWASIGSMGFNGVTPVNPDAVVHMWSSNWAGFNDMLADGYSFINNSERPLYIVPGTITGFDDYMNVAHVYDTWEATDFCYGYYLPEGHPQLLGTEAALWYDKNILASEFDIFSRFRGQIMLMSEKGWYGTKTEGQTGADFLERTDRVNQFAPGANPARHVESGSDIIASYDFEEALQNTVPDRSGNGYDALLEGTVLTEDSGSTVAAFDGKGRLSLPFASVGYPYTASFDLYIDEETPSNAVLFDGADGRLYLNYQGTGKMAYERKHYLYLFDYICPENMWMSVTLTCNQKDTALYIDGQLVSTGKFDSITWDYYQNMPIVQESSTFVLPTETIGAGLVGMLDNLVLKNRYTTQDEMAGLDDPDYTNYALHKPVTVSALEIEGVCTGDMVTDGDPTTRVSLERKHGAWLTVDLGEVMPIDRVEIDFYERPASYQLMVSQDGEHFETVKTLECEERTKGTDAFPLDGMKEIRYIKYQQIKMFSAGYSGTFYEVKAYRFDQVWENLKNAKDAIGALPPDDSNQVFIDRAQGIMERLENTIHDGTLKEIVRLNESVKEIVRRAASGETALPALDMSRLNALLNEDLKPHMFTKDSFAAYQGFLQLVQQRHIEDDINATQKQVDSLCRQLEGAKDGLVIAPAVQLESNRKNYTDPAGYEYALGYLVDGDLSTFNWTEENQRIGDYILISLREPLTVSRVDVYAPAPDVGGEDMLGGADFQLSMDGSTWTTVGTLDAQEHQVLTFAETTAHYARILVTKNKDRWLKLSEVIFNEKVIVDTYGLELALRDFEQEELYTVDSYSLYRTAHDQAEDLLAQEAYTQGQVDAAYDNLQSARGALVLRGNTAELSALVDSFTGLHPADYTKESWNVFEQALQRANAIVQDNSNSSQADADNALHALQTAFDGLLPVQNLLVITGAPESGSTRGAVTLMAEKEVTWTVNGVEVERASTTIQFRDEGTYTVTAKAGDAVSETIVFSIDRTAPVLTASVEHYGYTNQDVFFNASEEVTFYNGSEIISEGTELTLTESGTYNIRAIDKAGNYTAFYRVTIMKEAPVLTGAPEGVTRSNIAIRSNVKVLFIVNGVEAEDYAYGLRVLEEGKYTVKAVDMAGNESEVSFEIDRTKPTFTASVPSGQATGKDITLTANEVVDFVIDGVTVATGTEYTISRSGLTIVRIYDVAGNYGGVYKANIDKSAPVLSAVVEGTNKVVENGATVKQNVTVKTSKPSYFIVNDGEPTARANFVKLKASGTYTVKAVDMLGNVSEVFTVTIAK